MFLSKGIPLAVSEFQVKHQVSKDKVMSWVNRGGIHFYEKVEAYFLDSLLFYNGEYIHTLDRYRLEEQYVELFRGDLLDKQHIMSLLNHKTKPNLVECYAILAAYKAKESIKKFIQ